MRSCFVILGVLASQWANPWAHAEDIDAVLGRSQQARLERLEAAAPDSPRAERVRQTFALLQEQLHPSRAVELRITRDNPDLAETLRGDIVLVSESLGDLPETDRLFILAHELGHIRLEHWSQMGVLYQKWIPGDVTPLSTGPVAALLGRDASDLSYRQEFEADAFAMRLLHRLGRTKQEVVAVFMHHGYSPATPTHPGTGERVGAILGIDFDESPDAAAAAAPALPTATDAPR